MVNGIWMYFSFAIWRATRKIQVPYFLFIHGALDPWFERRYPIKHLKKSIYWAAFEHKVLRVKCNGPFSSPLKRKGNSAQGAFQPYQCNAVVTGYGILRPPGRPNANKARLIADLTSIYPGDP